MQLKNILLPTLAAIPTALATLPRTFELLAFQNGQRIGCINGYGNFITYRIACYPFSTYGVLGETNEIRGHEACNAVNGSFSCFETENVRSLFALNGADLELVGSGTQWSADSLPDIEDRYGVPTNIGGEGAVPIFLQVHPVQG